MTPHWMHVGGGMILCTYIYIYTKSLSVNGANFFSELIFPLLSLVSFSSFSFLSYARFNLPFLIDHADVQKLMQLKGISFMLSNSHTQHAYSIFFLSLSFSLFYFHSPRFHLLTCNSPATAGSHATTISAIRSTHS